MWRGKERNAPQGQETDAEAWQRLSAYAYLSAPERLEYVAVMRVFCGTLPADLSVPDLLTKPAERGGPGAGLDAETPTRRLEELVRWGDLLRSTHTVRATSISEYQRSRSRYQLSKAGERVQRDADEVLAGADAAREVSSELPALVDRGLRELAGMAATPGGADPQQALERISTLFVQFTGFAESVRDFYAYLGQVLARYDLDSAEYQGLKELLLDYVEAITEDVSFRGPRIAAHLDAVRPHLPAPLARIDAHTTGIGAPADGPPETRVRRSRGRDLADWEGMREWFTATGAHSSQVDQLRDATLRALRSLLANAKRMLRSASGEMSRRKDLLRLAARFDAAEPEEAHDLAVAAFGLYGARHLGVAPDPDRSVPAAHDTEFPTDAPARRALWRTASVPPDEVSSTVLTYGLRPTGTTWQETALLDRADHHRETHLTLRELRTLPLRLPPGTRIHVCENPRVVEAAADTARTAPLVCTSGSATTVVLTLLDALAASGCTFAYHGDFDRPGITLANRVTRRYATEPWRMRAPDYEHLATRTQLHGTPHLPLTGPPVETAWDPELAPAMEALGIALHEEAALDLLLEDLG